LQWYAPVMLAPYEGGVISLQYRIDPSDIRDTRYNRELNWNTLVYGMCNSKVLSKWLEWKTE
jgi:hypothetical protein